MHQVTWEGCRRCDGADSTSSGSTSAVVKGSWAWSTRCRSRSGATTVCSLRVCVMIGSFLAKSIPHSLCRYQGCSLNKESFCDFMYIMAAFVNHIEDCLCPQNRVCFACPHCRVALCRCHQDQFINRCSDRSFSLKGAGAAELSGREGR